MALSHVFLHNCEATQLLLLKIVFNHNLQYSEEDSNKTRNLTYYEEKDSPHMEGSKCGFLYSRPHLISPV